MLDEEREYDRSRPPDEVRCCCDAGEDGKSDMKKYPTGVGVRILGGESPEEAEERERTAVRNFYCPRCSRLANGIVTIFSEGTEWWCGYCVNSWSTDPVKVENDLRKRREGWEREVAEIERVRQSYLWRRQPSRPEDRRQTIKRAVSKVWADLGDEPLTEAKREAIAGAVEGVMGESWAESHQQAGRPLDIVDVEDCESGACLPERVSGEAGWRWCASCDKPVRFARPVYRNDREGGGIDD